MDKISVTLYIILALSAMLFLLAKSDSKKLLSGKTALICKSVIFILLCISELYYFKYEENGTWFCQYKEVGWKVIIGFLGLCLVLFNQFSGLMNILFNLYKGNKAADYRIGIYSYIASIIIFFICSFISEFTYTKIILHALLIAQVGQIVFIFYTNSPYWKNAIISTLIYLLGTITLMISFFYFLIPFAAATLIWIGFYILSIIYPQNKIHINIRIKSE